MWTDLTEASQLNELLLNSAQKPALIFKHSTRCSISQMALDRLSRQWKREDAEKVEPFYLDLLRHRDISNLIAERFGVVHESPQVLVIQNGECVYHASHQDIRLNSALEKIA